MNIRQYYQEQSPLLYVLLKPAVFALLLLTANSCYCQIKKAKRNKVFTRGEPNLTNGMGAFATGNYRNVFKEAGHTENEITARIDRGFQQLFYGDSASRAIYFQAGKNENGSMAYVCDVLHNDIRSEGMSYGLMICVQLNKKQEFDAIWNYSMTHMYEDRPEHPSEGYFHWSLKRNGTPNEETPASDGEEYFVMALYFASARWGNGKGIYNYKAWADKILTTIRHHPLKTGDTKLGPRTVHTMVSEEFKMILFVPVVGANKFTDPSYHLPAFYELWARWGPKADRRFWAAAADTSRIFFRRAANLKTGLASDYAHFDGTPFEVKWNPQAAHFSFDSWRTASNWAVDWSWWHKDTGEQELSNRIQVFFASKGLERYGSQFTVDGKQLEDHHAKGLVSTNAVVSLAATHKLAIPFVEALWKTEVPVALGERYYDGLLYLLSMLHCGGRYRIWTPN